MNEEMQKIIDNVDLSWPKDYIIRYLYVKLAPFFKKDVNYFLLSDEDKMKEYQKGFINRGFNIVCSTISDYFVNLYRSFGINAQKIAANSAKIPLFAVIVEGDHGWFFIDPLNDLFNNQYGLKTTEFGSIPHYQTLANNYPYLISLPKEYIDQMDADLGIDKTLDDFIERIHIEMTNRNIVTEHFGLPKNDRLGLFERKMEFANDHLINIGQVNGPFERLKLYLLLERVMFFKTEKRHITINLNAMQSSLCPHIEYRNPYDGVKILFEEQKVQDQFKLKKIY